MGSRYSWRMDFSIPNYGIASAIRHKGVNHNDHGYDHAKKWPAGASAITSDIHKKDGEMTSAYKDASGKWQWFARYNVGSFDIKSNKAASAPYFTFMYSGGGPSNCDEKNSDGFDTKNWEIFALVKDQREKAKPSTCFDVFTSTPGAPNGEYEFLMSDGKTKWKAYCDISGGGWTRLYTNSFKSNHNGITYKIDCPCGGNAGMNNGARAHDGNGWHLGVTNCHNSNKLSDNIGGKSSRYSWRMDFTIPNYGIASAIRHTGVNHNDHGYDHAKSWPAGASAITSNVHKKDGEFASAYKDASGKWQWFAKYNLGTFDIKSSKPASAPYFTYMYSGGGPGNCDESNSDGFDTKDWSIYGLFTHPRPAPAKSCYALSQQKPKPPNGVYTL